MRLTVVGSAPAYTARSACASSCYLVEHEGTAVLLDMGQGSFSELWRYRRPDEINAVFISHLHADHCVDLIPLRHWVRFENGGRGPALHGPADLRGRLGDFQADPGFLDDLAGDALEPGSSITVGSLLVEARRVTHIPDSFGFRVSPADGGGAGVVYSGDCSNADDLLPLLRAGDAFVCEAALGLGRTEGGPHLTVHDAVRVATAGGAARLVLTHILDRNDQAEVLRAAQAKFDGQVDLARPGLSMDVDQ